MKYRNCNICKEPQEVTSEALKAWDDLIFNKNHGKPCLCTDCYWALMPSGA